MNRDISELEMEERTIGLQKRIAAHKEELPQVVEAKIDSDISDLELQERTVGIPMRVVNADQQKEGTPVVEAKINSDISDLELEERTIGMPIKPAPVPQHKSAPEGKAKKPPANSNKNSGCGIAFLALGASALLSIWGITRIT